jgi:tetratricopeptide (TPR) repeat protein
MALLEWEFTEGDGNDGQFMPTGKVIEFLRQHLAKGEVDAAVALYESCVEGVGDQLWNEFVNASTPTKKSIANLFYRARDYKRAAEACSQLEEWGAAARAYAAAYEFPKAAECYTKANDSVRAASMYEKAGQARKAAEIYYAAGKLKESADALEKAGDLVGAGQLAIRMEDHSRAAHLLAQVPQNDPRFVQATGLLSEVLVKLNRRDLATQRLAAAVPPGSIVSDKMTAELAYRLGRLMWEAGQNDQARRAFELVNAWDPKYKDVTAALASLKGGATIAEEETDPFRPTSATVPMRPLPKREIPPPKVTDPFAALDGNPFAPKAGSITAATTLPRGAPPRAAETVRIAYTQRMEGYDALKALPIFEDLSLDEMKAFYNICESAFYPKGEVIIEQGHKGEGLLIIVEGTCVVTKIEQGGKETQLATIGHGKYVGDMSLIDDVPTSARVRAQDNVKALLIKKDRFEQFLFANDRIAVRVYRTFVKTLSERLRQQNARA